MMRISVFAFLVLLLTTGCVSTPYAHVGASKTVNVGGIDVHVGVGDILRP